MARRGSQRGHECHWQGVLGLRVSLHEGRGLKTDFLVSPWMGLVLGHWKDAGTSGLTRTYVRHTSTQARACEHTFE